MRLKNTVKTRELDIFVLQEWKIVDEKKLAGRLRHALRGLEQVRIVYSIACSHTYLFRRDLRHTFACCCSLRFIVAASRAFFSLVGFRSLSSSCI
jgi:hypothetical protein